MTIATMKFLDMWVGGPFCLVLSALSRLSRLFSQKGAGSNGVKGILVTKYFGMGSILLSVPLFRALRRLYPGVRIGFLTFSDNRELCEILHQADCYYFLRKGNMVVFISDLLKALQNIRRDGYDMVVDMEFFSNFSMIVSVLSGAGERVGYFARRPGREGLLTKPVYFNQRSHVTQVFLSLSRIDPFLSPAAGDGDHPELLSPREEDRRDAASLLSEIGLDGFSNKPIVAINVNASELCLERRWPGEYFISLSEKLLRETQAVLVFIGGRADHVYVEGIVSCLRGMEQWRARVHNISGRLSLGELIAFLQRCALFVTNDSGPLHIAVSTGTRTASFFGPETPSLYGPRGDGHLVFYRGFYCSPCLNVYNAKTASCRGNNRCMSAITPDEVYHAIRERFPDIWRA